MQHAHVNVLCPKSVVHVHVHVEAVVVLGEQRGHHGLGLVQHGVCGREDAVVTDLQVPLRVRDFSLLRRLRRHLLQNLTCRHLLLGLCFLLLLLVLSGGPERFVVDELLCFAEAELRALLVLIGWEVR